MDKQELEELMKKAENGILTREELISQGAQTILTCYSSALHAYGKYKRNEVYSSEDMKKILRHAINEMADQEHGAKELYIPSLLLLYQELHNPRLKEVK